MTGELSEASFWNWWRDRMSEKILLVCTSSSPKVQQALQVLQGQLFKNPQVDFLCTLKDLPPFEGERAFQQVMVFPRRDNYRGAFRLWKRIIHSRYDVVAVLWCLESERIRSKLFALFCGGRRILVFNEYLDCDYLSPAFLKRLVKARAANGTLCRSGWWSKLFQPLMDGYFGIIRILLFPLQSLSAGCGCGVVVSACDPQGGRPVRDRKKVETVS